jgi:hypothetical protein
MPYLWFLIFACNSERGTPDSTATTYTWPAPVSAGEKVLQGSVALSRNSELTSAGGTLERHPSSTFYAGASFYTAPYFPDDLFVGDGPVCVKMGEDYLLPLPANVDVGPVVVMSIAESPINLRRFEWDEETIQYDWFEEEDFDVPAALHMPGSPVQWEKQSESVPMVDPFDDMDTMMDELYQISLLGQGGISVNTAHQPSQLIFGISQLGPDGHTFTSCRLPDDGELEVALTTIGVTDMSTIYRLSIQRIAYTILEGAAEGPVILSVGELVTYSNHDVY